MFRTEQYQGTSPVDAHGMFRTEHVTGTGRDGTHWQNCGEDSHDRRFSEVRDTTLGQKLRNQFAMDVRQSELPALESIGQLLVIESQEVQ